jgi:uncharacterized delta-60 repeat protein
MLDLPFADNGIFSWDINGGHDVPGAMDIQEDGKMVFVLSAIIEPLTNFDLAIVRLNEDGTIDSSFAVNGLYYYSNPVAYDLAYDIQILGDGKILAVGGHGPNLSSADLFLVKLNSDGTPDTTFGDNGVVIHALEDGEDYARSIAITAEGKILIAGQSQSSTNDFHFRNVVCRFTENGILDSTFAEDGVFMWNDNMTDNRMNNIAIADDGNIIASGFSAPSGVDRLSIYKIMADGSSLDTSFGNNGEVLAPFGNAAEGMIIHSNGNILVTGSNSNVNGVDLVVLAYHQDGTVNTDFGQDGTFLLDIDVNDRAVSLIEQPGGRIIAVGSSGGAFQQGNPGAFLSVRIDAMGNLDTSWGGDGYVVTPMPTGLGALANDVAIQHDGKVVLAGPWAEPQGNEMLVMRYGNFIDEDMDGFEFFEECNDLDFAINPDAEEIPNNGIDEDCDGEDLTVGVQETALAQRFNLYPNPTNGEVNITYNTGELGINFIEISDYTGKKIRRINTANSLERISVSIDDLPQGLWMFIIHTTNGVAVKRVLKN